MKICIRVFPSVTNFDSKSGSVLHSKIYNISLSNGANLLTIELVREVWEKQEDDWSRKVARLSFLRSSKERRVRASSKIVVAISDAELRLLSTAY